MKHTSVHRKVDFSGRYMLNQSLERTNDTVPITQEQAQIIFAGVNVTYFVGIALEVMNATLECSAWHRENDGEN
ncbi:hypothetical protein [Pelagovum sp. HNIBRBA483]|uniref:hypothetical protein n=1 Tax=Pelagovum sp. HNIBRBA483 TaxID=3233341 RepID=UPI0034A28DB9